ncbi:methylenetetrahydrofolate reductase [Motiliproteus sp. MSK22-1]|uniref:methylenetetrahydrofolate reductase n=1 Tax=Motiliproteus sp. MSK22-1 TaxID=1897630 RepID=UPI000978CCC7|nr:methylenetetrahydrofolate reductase [Motiliproteus sp. MSK22-1]OMH36227.1 hypothetical protein BGP75_09745 [Motiliproteus sp. MSK22-1]
MDDAYSSMLSDFSLETTAQGAEHFQMLSDVPEGTQVKVAFLGNETFDQRLSAIEVLCASRVCPMPIISARRLESAWVLDSYLTQAKQVGQIESIFLVGGDPSTPQGVFADSLDVINSNILDRFDIKTVGIAGYPEGHPRIHTEVLWACLKRKVDELSSRGFSVEITTQLSFDAERVIFWVEQIRSEGIHVPIRIGIPSPSTVKGLLKFAGQCRVGTSLRLLRQYGWQVTSLLGNVGPADFLEAFREGVQDRDLGDVRLHVFPMGDLSTVMLWMKGVATQPCE